MTPPPPPAADATTLEAPILRAGVVRGGLVDRVGGIATVLRFMRFAAVGGLASAVYLCLTFAFMQAGVHYMTAASTAFACAIVTNFSINRTWTFGRGERHVLLQLSAFAAVQLSMAVLNLSMLYMVVETVGFGPVALNQLAVAGVLLPVNFIASRRWGFR
ncbi:MAG TPA: GtrA family protein [Miltoncostaeaceae bacterium]|jgi:putative flippase GtrA|nr:GtrA family protein [Miltoncostaeaceae bacterium]